MGAMGSEHFMIRLLAGRTASMGRVAAVLYALVVVISLVLQGETTRILPNRWFVAALPIAAAAFTAASRSSFPIHSLETRTFPALFPSTSRLDPRSKGHSAFSALRSLPANVKDAGADDAAAATEDEAPSPLFNVYFDSSNRLHRDVQYHPEQPERIDACVRAILASELVAAPPSPPPSLGDGAGPAAQGGVVRLVDVAPDAAGSSSSSDRERGVIREPFSSAELERARTMLVMAHSEELVGGLERSCREAKQRRLDANKSDPLGHMGYVGGDLDCFVTTESYGVCLRAAAAWIRAASAASRAASNGRIGAAMALVRPPGHHATRTLQNGFCLYNFAAAAALSVLSPTHGDDATTGSETKVSVLDFDVHYGQGTADILASNPRARYVSIHQTPAFPYQGEALHVSGDHQNVFTIPIPPSTTWACGYEDAYDKALRFCMEAGVWEPDAVVVSAGFDALDSDPLASVGLQADDFGRMADRLHRHLDRESSSPRSARKKKPAIVLGLEGGYQLSDMSGGGNLPDAVVATIRAMLAAQKRDKCRDGATLQANVETL